MDKKNQILILLLLFSQISSKKIAGLLEIEESVVNNLVNQLRKEGYDLSNESVKEISCPNCNSVKIYPTYQCPSCSGTSFKNTSLVEHHNCGEVYPKEIGSDICPKCNKNIGLMGVTYHEFQNYYFCYSCQDKFSFPNQNFDCLKCKIKFRMQNANWVQAELYKISSNPIDVDGNTISIQDILNDNNS